jgi:ribosomal protein S12 methylthiotransferase accessory factor
MELLQRDGNVVSYRALDQGVVVDLDAVDSPRARAAGAAAAMGIGVTVKLAPTISVIPNIYVWATTRTPPSRPAHPPAARRRISMRALRPQCAAGVSRLAARASRPPRPIEAIRCVMPRVADGGGRWPPRGREQEHRPVCGDGRMGVAG